MQLVFATNNANKLREAQQILPNYKIISLEDAGIHEELPETHETILENSKEKAEYLYNKYHINCFSDDTGLEVEALGGAPGVYSARFAGPQKNNDDNIALILQKLQGVENRKARFVTYITLIINGEQHIFEGEMRGSILPCRSGNGGFGYDPVFLPEGYDKSVAELSPEEKNKISHRGRSLQKMAEYLSSK
ncbi:MAG: RdgB/HAM1 family non-canonical purine NTP pyrophosphatase [Bacteroidales bacterium]|nr:RdgB/HAM1 family non-canonical purine NTP pyrophosphatase [Bacteroidales bacterium]